MYESIADEEQMKKQLYFLTSHILVFFAKLSNSGMKTKEFSNLEIVKAKLVEI